MFKRSARQAPTASDRGLRERGLVLSYPSEPVPGTVLELGAAPTAAVGNHGRCASALTVQLELNRTESYGIVRNSANVATMPTINSDEVRIPRRAREAVTRHEQVVVLNRERPMLVIVHPDDLPRSGARRRGRPVREIASELAAAPAPDPDFAHDMDAVRSSVGPMPEVPWEPS